MYLFIQETGDMNVTSDLDDKLHYPETDTPLQTIEECNKKVIHCILPIVQSINK